MIRWIKAGGAGILAAGVCLGAAAWSDARELAGRRAELQREARLIASLVAARMQGGLEKHLTAMRQMANLYASSRRVGEGQFRSYAANTLKLNPACLNIAYVDPALRIQRSYPLEAARWRPVFDARSHPPGYETVVRADRARKPMLSPPMQLFGGTWGFVLAVPVVSGNRLLGSLVGACRGQEYFDSLVPREVNERYEQVVLDAGTPIFMSNLLGSSDSPVAPVSEKFVIGGAGWEVRVGPQEHVVRDRLTAGRPVFWAMAWLFSVTFGALAGGAALWAVGMSNRLQTQRAALVEARTRLDGAQEQLIQAEKMTALGDLVAGVAHEINNPLTGIVGYTQLLIQRKLPPSVHRHLETISAEGQRIVKIVRNLLSFARKHAPEKRLIDLNEVVEKTLELKAYHLRSNQIKVVEELAPRLPKTLLDFHQMQQVLINLLNNAEQAMVESGRGHTIRLATVVVEGHIQLRVSDDGPGIAAEILERVLEPFFTTKKEGEGTGLGLSLCNGIVQEHGGRIRVESPPGEGATFIVELPIQQKAASIDPILKPSAPKTVEPLRVLVVDDETDVQEFLTELLGLGGHRVDTASDVPEAIAKIAAGAHDLIIVDLKMPNGTGRDIYAAVLELRPRLARRLIFITGQATGDDMADFLAKTGNELVLKPFNAGEIEDAMARAARN
ncbi:MAG: hypothetical protein AUI47_03735 [Acidobacteria bacterium 13_1_40CM_2_68_5]|nr:MAG: hypothetical protein AUI47_03735 [Acidobacteria bacterium 13_1_40CM_2_68_5]